MGYQDWQASQRDTDRAIAAANAAKTAADNAVAIAKAVTANAPTTIAQQASQQAAVNAANAAIAKYNTAATYAQETNLFSADWFGLGTEFLQSNNISVYEPIQVQSVAGPQAIQKFVTGVTFSGTGASRMKITTWSDGTTTTEAAPDTSVSAEETAKRVSAWNVLKDKFDAYGLGSLADTVKTLILDGASTEEVTIKLRATPEYAKRFAGNATRKAAGLNVYDEATYLDLENAYVEAFTAYGQKDLLGTTAEQKQAKMAGFIGGTIAPTEIKSRLQTATLLATSDSSTKAAIKKLYPMITDSDIVSYFLDPEQTLPKLEVKAQAAQIGGAFLRQGLATDVVSAEEYAAMGITKAQAEQATAEIATTLPRGEFLSEITAGAEDYTQKTAEDVYLKGLASAKRAQEQLRAAEIGRFSGSSGMSKTSLSQPTSGLI